MLYQVGISVLVPVNAAKKTTQVQKVIISQLSSKQGILI